MEDFLTGLFTVLGVIGIILLGILGFLFIVAIQGLIYWGIGALIIWVFNIPYTWTFWHGVAIAFIIEILSKIFKKEVVVKND